MAITINDIVEITQEKETWKLKVRCIRLWYTSKNDTPEDRNYMEMILMDEQGTKIQATVKKNRFNKVSQVVREGGFYYMVNFGIDENDGDIRATRHAYKLDFHPHTLFKSYETLPIPQYGFDFVGFDEIISDRDYEKYLVAEVVGVGNLEVSDKYCHQMKRVTIRLQDEE